MPLNAAAGQTPDWHARDADITLDQGQVVITVGNRGKLDAPGVTVQCWVLSAVGPTPDDDPNVWIPLAASTPAQTVKHGSTVPFRFELPTGGATLPAGDYWVKASASCVDDPSNIDPAAGLAPATQEVALAELVSADNNLGLHKVTI